MILPLKLTFISFETYDDGFYKVPITQHPVRGVSGEGGYNVVSSPQIQMKLILENSIAMTKLN